jgi:hypothetical protein
VKPEMRQQQGVHARGSRRVFCFLILYTPTSSSQEKQQTTAAGNKINDEEKATTKRAAELLGKLG